MTIDRRMMLNKLANDQTRRSNRAMPVAEMFLFALSLPAKLTNETGFGVGGLLSFFIVLFPNQ